MNSKQVESINRYSMGGVGTNLGLSLDDNVAMLPKSYHPILDFIPRSLTKSTNSCVLDLAMGNGQSSEYLERKKIKVLRSDLSFGSLLSNTGLRTRCCADELPFKNESFDAIHFKDALVHIENHKKFFKEIRRVLKPSGVLLLTTVQEENRPYFNYIIRNGIFLHSCKQMNFLSLIDYCHMVENIENNKSIIHIDPPYFPTTKWEIDLNLQINNLNVIENFEWKPKILEHDWYDDHRPRLVYMAIKK